MAAALAHDEEARRRHGARARVNFPRGCPEAGKEDAPEVGGSEPSQLLLSLGPLKAVGRTLQRECYLAPAASAVAAAETAAAEVPAPRMKKVKITAAASATALQRAEVAEVEMMEVEVKGIDEAEAAVAQDEAAVAPACDYCNSRGKVHRRCLRLPSCDVAWNRGKRRHGASRTAEAAKAAKAEAAEAEEAAEAAETAEAAQAETAKAATVVEAKRQCAPTQSSASYKKSLLRRWVAEEPAAGSAATVEPAEVRQTDAAEAALRQAEAEGLAVQRCGSKTGFRNVQKTRSSKFQAVVWRQTRGGVKRVGLGTFSTAEEAALAYARTPEAQAEQVAGAGTAAAAAAAAVQVQAAAVQVQAAASQCESKPRGTRGFNHFDEGGKYSLRTRPAEGYAFLEQTAEGEVEQDDGGGCFCGVDDLQSVGITFNGMSHWSTFNDSWIQCDDCDRWCHSQCAGFDEQSAEEVESYSCPTCLYAARTKPTKHVLSGNAVDETTAAAASASAAESEAAAALRVEPVEVMAEAPAAIEAAETADVFSWRFTKLEMDTIPEEDEDEVEHEDEDGVEEEEEGREVEDKDELDSKVEAAAMQQAALAEGTPDVGMDVLEMMCTSPDQWGMLYAPVSGLFRI